MLYIDDVSRGTDAAATTDTPDAAKEAAPSAFNENGDNNQSETSQTTTHEPPSPDIVSSSVPTSARRVEPGCTLDLDSPKRQSAAQECR